MGAPRQHIRREVRIGVRLPANHDEIAGEVAQQNVVLDLRVLCGTSHAEAHVPVRGSVKRVPCGLNGMLPWVSYGPGRSKSGRKRYQGGSRLDNSPTDHR